MMARTPLMANLVGKPETSVPGDARWRGGGLQQRGLAPVASGAEAHGMMGGNEERRIHGTAHTRPLAYDSARMKTTTGRS